MGVTANSVWPDTRINSASEQECATTMSIERAERLKRELTDKWVVVAESVPELKRFAKFTGKVKTVNMNGRALVEFDGPADIGWYDIDPSFLTVVDGPRPKAKPEAHAEKPVAKAAPKAAAVPASGSSPLDKIRAAGASAPKPAGGSPLDKIRAAGASAASAAAPGGSPLDKIRAAGSGKAEPSGEPTSPTEAPKAAASPTPSMGGSPLDRIRAMGAPKKE